MSDDIPSDPDTLDGTPPSRDTRRCVRVEDLPESVIDAMLAWTPQPGGYVLDDLDEDGTMKRK